MMKVSLIALLVLLGDPSAALQDEQNRKLVYYPVHSPTYYYTPPTPYPTHKPPTPWPTGKAPTNRPTPYPVPPPTPYPVPVPSPYHPPPTYSNYPKKDPYNNYYYPPPPRATHPPTPNPTPEPTPVPTKRPTDDPTPNPTQKPTTASPTFSPPTRSPTAMPSPLPTPLPTTLPPTPEPTALPTKAPTPLPSKKPTPVPSEFPSSSPTIFVPSDSPTRSAEPSESPTQSEEPSENPTLSAEPSENPTDSAEPSENPTQSAEPSSSPSASFEPTLSPTFFGSFPTEFPTTLVQVSIYDIICAPTNIPIFGILCQLVNLFPEVVELLGGPAVPENFVPPTPVELEELYQAIQNYIEAGGPFVRNRKLQTGNGLVDTAFAFERLREDNALDREQTVYGINRVPVPVPVNTDRTLFAPTNFAFIRLISFFGEEFVASLFTVEGRPLLKNILCYHVIKRELDFERLFCGISREMVNGETTITRCRNGFKFQVGNDNLGGNRDPRIVIADEFASNGVIHVVDNVIVPSLPSESPSMTPSVSVKPSGSPSMAPSVSVKPSGSPSVSISPSSTPSASPVMSF